LQAGVPLNLAQRWLGHARISTTAIYAAACGPEERALAVRFWRNDGMDSREVEAPR
jgi:site-specific recombinase XerD